MTLLDTLIAQRKTMHPNDPRLGEINASIYQLRHAQLVQGVRFVKTWEAHRDAIVREAMNGHP